MEGDGGTGRGLGEDTRTCFIVQVIRMVWCRRSGIVQESDEGEIRDVVSAYVYDLDAQR